MSTPSSYSRLDRNSARMVEVTYGNNEWKTPFYILDLVLEVTGLIDLDPASDSPNAKGEYHVPATNHYDRATNGLDKPWHGTVYLNPPYGTEVTNFIKKLIYEIGAGRTKEAIVLVANRADTAWFKEAWKIGTACFVHGRIKFLDVNNVTISGTQFSSVFFYYGPREDKFVKVFSRLGQCVRTVQPEV